MPEKLSLALLILVTLISLFCIGLVYLSRNIALKVRMYFCLAIVNLILWVITLYLSNLESGLVLFFNHIVYVWPILGMFFFRLFIDASYSRPTHKRLTVLMGSTSLLAIAGASLAVTDLNVESVRPRLVQGELAGYDIVPGPLSWLVFGTLITLAAIVAVRILIALRAAPTRKKKPLQIILSSLIIMFSVSLATNVVAPIIFGGSGFGNALSNLTVVIFITSVAYSVLHYSFLDIRLLVMRSIGYGAGLVSILLMVAGLQVLIFGAFTDGNALTGQQQIVLILLSILAAVSFNPLRKLFAKVTSRLFFKDVYDPARFISAFNASLVKNIEIDKLLTESARVIEQTIKTNYCAIEVEETHDTPRYLFGTELPGNIKEADRLALSAAARRLPYQVIVKRLSEDRLHNGALIRLMGKYEVEMIVKLMVTVKDNESVIGHIVMGPKKNGDPYNKTDIEMMTIVANELALAIQNALRFEVIEQFNITLQQKIANATNRLQHTNDRLRTLDQTKDDFISMASHQLRTPLTSVKGYISMVVEGDAGEITPLQKKLLNQAFVSSQRMVYLISDLLNVSRLRTGKFIIEAVPTNLVTVAKEEVSQLMETAKSRGIELTFNHSDHFPVYMLDETKMRQVIMNFIDNAIYYTPQDGHISVNIVERAISIEVTITDDGMGVPKSEQPHLFTKFFRAENAKHARPDGTGLGLFMAKKVVVAQGGAIIFKSHEGKGSIFGFTFAKDKLTVVENYTPVKSSHNLLHQASSSISSSVQKQSTRP